VPLAVYTDADLTDALRESLQLGPTIHYTKSRLKPEEFARAALELIGEAAPETQGTGRSA